MSPNTAEGNEIFPHDGSESIDSIANDVTEEHLQVLEILDIPEDNRETLRKGVIQLLSLVENQEQLLTEQQEMLERQDEVIEDLSRHSRETEELEERIDALVEQKISISVIEYVLQNYGFSEEEVDEIVETMEAVDQKTGGNDE